MPVKIASGCHHKIFKPEEWLEQSGNYLPHKTTLSKAEKKGLSTANLMAPKPSSFFLFISLLHAGWVPLALELMAARRSSVGLLCLGPI